MYSLVCCSTDCIESRQFTQIQEGDRASYLNYLSSKLLGLPLDKNLALSLDSLVDYLADLTATNYKTTSHGRVVLLSVSAGLFTVMVAMEDYSIVAPCVPLSGPIRWDI